MTPGIYINNYNRIFSVRLMWDIGQPFVCGTLEQVVKYALQPNNGIEYFCEIDTHHKVRKVPKKELKEMLLAQGLKDMSIELFKKY